MQKKFDLNIEKILDNWENYHAIREIIANAIDEQTLTQSNKIEIFKDNNGFWHIRDYGRGLQHHHFTQNENEEKKHSNKVIGKFGVGLKDAVAVLFKHNVDVRILSKFGDITFAMCPKTGFSDTRTLHAIIDDPSDYSFVGTDFIMKVSDHDIEMAKSLFLMFSNRQAIDTVKNGEIYAKGTRKTAYIYVHGVKVAEEENYLFDYNITITNAALNRALNRERSNVGRSAYTDIVKKMLTTSQDKRVISALIQNLQKISSGTNCDEISWIDVQIHAIKKYNQQERIVVLSSDELYKLTNDDKEKIKESKRQIVIVPRSTRDKIQSIKDYGGSEIGTFDIVVKEYNESFQYRFVDLDDLTESEKNVLSLKDFVFSIYGDKYFKDHIFVSENINPSYVGDVLGCHEGSRGSGRIILKRSTLSSKSQFCEVLFHELVHGTTGYPDNNRSFENELGRIIGMLSQMIIEARK